jgi:hypothetical protein
MAITLPFCFGNPSNNPLGPLSNQTRSIAIVLREGVEEIVLRPTGGGVPTVQGMRYDMPARCHCIDMNIGMRLSANRVGRLGFR